jgi:inhibitor of KinA sporulation pathway (predicted exonuclease)
VKDINLLSLDMEYNQPSETIIQIGYVIGSMATGNILEKVRRYVKVEESINPFIVNLTGVTDKHIEEQGIPLTEIYEEMKTLHKKHNCFRNALTWGGGDSADLRNALGLDEERYLLGRRWIDAKTLYISMQFANNGKTQAGLAKALINLGYDFDGRKHDALDDAYNTFRAYRRLAALMKKAEKW